MNGALCLPTVTTNSRALGPLHVEIRQSHVERVVALRIEFHLGCER